MHIINQSDCYRVLAISGMMMMVIMKSMETPTLPIAYPAFSPLQAKFTCGRSYSKVHAKSHAKKNQLVWEEV